MNIREILDRLKDQPFEPFTVVTNGGDRYEVRHPENAHLAPRGVLYVFYPAGEEIDGVAVEQPVRISLLHITTLEPLVEKAT